MTEQEIRDCVSEWQARLGLDQWLLEVRFEEPENETAAMECHRSNQYEQAALIIKPDLVEWEKPEDWFGPALDSFFLEKSIVHELLHCHTRDIRYVEDMYEEQLHRDVQSVVEAAYVRAEEQMVDRLAVALVRAWNG
jgi:hypothetical protein